MIQSIEPKCINICICYLCLLHIFFFWKLIKCFLKLSIFFKALGLGHGQDLRLRLITEIRNIQEHTRTAGNSGATIAASGGRTTSGDEGGATFHVDATNVVVGTTTTTITTTTSAQTGRISSKTLKNSSTNSSSSNNKIVHEDSSTISRSAQEAPLTVSHTSLTDLPRHYPDTLSILPPHTPPLPNVDQPCCWQTITPKR